MKRTLAMRIVVGTAPLLVLLLSCASSDDDAVTSGVTETSVAVLDSAAGDTVANGAFGAGVIAGDAFRPTGQFVQFDPLSGAWRLHFVEGANTCDDNLASL